MHGHAIGASRSANANGARYGLPRLAVRRNVTSPCFEKDLFSVFFLFPPPSRQQCIAPAWLDAQGTCVSSRTAILARRAGADRCRPRSLVVVFAALAIATRCSTEDKTSKHTSRLFFRHLPCLDGCTPPPIFPAAEHAHASTARPAISSRMQCQFRLTGDCDL